MSNHTITVFGSSAGKPGEPAYDDAYALGAAIAAAGWTLCNGGYGGTMEAACRGAVETGGETIGVSCSAFRRPGVNQWVRREVKTDTLHDRIAKLIELGDAYVVLPGSTGTLLELASVWELTNKGFLTGKPIIVHGQFWAPVVAVIARESMDSLRHVHPAKSIREIVPFLRTNLSL